MNVPPPRTLTDLPAPTDPHSNGSFAGTVDFDPDSTTAFQRRMERAPDWFCSFLAGNTREKNRLRSELTVMKGSVVWLVRQRRLGHWSAPERTHLRQVMRSASSVSPYLIIWVVPGSMLLLPFLAWFIDHKRKSRRAADQD